MYINTLFLFLPLFHLPPSFCLPLEISQNIHLCKSVNLVFSPRFTGKRWNILFILVYLNSFHYRLMGSWRNQIYSQEEIPQTNQIVAPFWPFSLLLYDFKTEFKIKWLVNLVAFFGALLFLLLPPCGWTAASQSVLPSGSIKFIICTPRIYLHEQNKECVLFLHLEEYTVDIFPSVF